MGAPARASDCVASSYATVASDRDVAIVEAGSLSSSGRWADARAVYLWVLARHEDDPEALFGLARLDAWGGCYPLAEAGYLRVLSTHPEDADVRAAYVDLLLWEGSLDDAERILARGLALDPGAPPLLERAARLAYWSGDATAALRLADAAERAAPDDGDLRAERDRLFLGEARATARLDRYPSPYQDLATVGAQVLQRIRRFDLYGGAEMVARLGQPSVVDAHYPVGLAFHPSTGVTFGGEIEPGAPARAIADVALKVWAQAPLTHRFDASLAYQFWHFSAGPELVHIFNPAIGVALPDDLRLELRAWLSAATLLTQPTLATQPSGASSTGVTGAAGFQLSWRASARLDLGFACTYGAELDQNPALLQLLAYRALVVNAYADRLFSRSWGLRPTLGIDRREAPGGTALWVPSVEVSAYTRW